MHYENIQRAIDYIEENLKSDLDMNEVIRCSGYSITHFYRIFQAMVGSSLKEYITKRRLSSAAIEIATSKKRLIEIAVDYGYNSQEVFTRAFFRLYHMTPGKYRKDQIRIRLYEKCNVYQKTLANMKYFIESKIILEKEFKLVGMERIVKPGGMEIQELWKQFSARKKEIKNGINMQQSLGLCEYMPDITDESEFKYMACVEVTDIQEMPKDMSTKVIPCMKYAVFSHIGEMITLKETYSRIYGAWLPFSNCELAEMDTIEVYGEDENKRSTLEIYIPLKIEARS